MYSIGWTIKILVFQMVLSTYVVINTFLLLDISSTGWLYLESDKVLKEPQQKTISDAIFSTLNADKIVHIPISWVCSNKLFHLSEFATALYVIRHFTLWTSFCWSMMTRWWQYRWWQWWRCDHCIMNMPRPMVTICQICKQRYRSGCFYV